jgi:hypothetical protein
MNVFVTVFNSFYTKPEKGSSFKKFLYSISMYQIRYKLLYSFFRVIPRLLNFMCRRFGTLSSIFIGAASSLVYTAYEDGTDRVFQNVGTYNSDAEESPKARIQHSKHGESLQSRRYELLFYGVWWTTG